MAEMVTAWDLHAGDVMMDPNGNLTVRSVQRFAANGLPTGVRGSSAYVEVRVEGETEMQLRSGRVLAGTFAATWTFGADDLIRVVTRSGSAVGR